ncbi:MAG TPA: DUF1559 domain-containing protein [Phycisphaerales bacterium]|nr:DUF1559 domain-containing protein [Phycisphaerales bacterium]
MHSRLCITRSQNAPAFTLVELLVCIGVMALLLGLLLPSLKGAAGAGRATQCKNNLRQLGIAAANYTALYNAFPCAIRFDNSNGQFKQIAWDWVTTLSGQVISPGPLWEFSNNPGEVMQCPDFHGSSTSAGDPYTGYNYNTTYLGGEASFPAVGWSSVRRGVPLAACRRTSTCVMFGEGGWKSGANKFMRAPGNSENLPLNLLYAGGQAFRHAGHTHAVCIDGHVADFEHPRKGTLATDPLLMQIMSFSDNGFLSDDDSLYDPR